MGILEPCDRIQGAAGRPGAQRQENELTSFARDFAGIVGARRKKGGEAFVYIELAGCAGKAATALENRKNFAFCADAAPGFPGRQARVRKGPATRC